MHPVPDPTFDFVPTVTGLARIVPTMMSDVFPVTPNRFTTAVFGTSAWKCALIFFGRTRQEVRSCTVPSISRPIADPELQDDPAGR